MSILKVSIRQVKAARSLLAWSQSDLAQASGVSEPTIKRLESQDGELGGRADTVAKIVEALATAGIEFTNGKHPGVKMKNDPTYGFLYDDQRIVGKIKDGEFRGGDNYGELFALVKSGNLHHPETGDWICELAGLEQRGIPFPEALKKLIK